MSWFSGLCRAGYLLKRLAMKAKFNLGFPRTTSVAVTNCRQPSLSACCNMHSALWMSSFSCKEKGHVKVGPRLSMQKGGRRNMNKKWESYCQPQCSTSDRHLIITYDYLYLPELKLASKRYLRNRETESLISIQNHVR